jgi:Fe-S-cluster containining protein
VNPDDADATAVCIEECGGHCCSGGAFLRQADAARLVAASEQDAVAANGYQTRTDEAGDCVLLDDEGRCRVYEERPLDCRLFPLGYELDDDQRVVHVVLIGCPLGERYSRAERRDLVERGRSFLDEFDVDTLRRYDELSFTGSYESLTTIPYDTLPHEL